MSVVEKIPDILFALISSSWDVLATSAPWMLLGFVVAGMFHAFMPGDVVSRHMGGKGIAGIIKASILGIPVPLCSCGVLPAAAGLKKQGAGKGPVTSFLISTPETGVDSIAVTYALLDPFMTVIRPVVSFFTAMVAGVSVEFFERFGTPSPVEDAVARSSSTATCCSGSCCGGKSTSRHVSFHERFRAGFRFAFTDLLGDIGKWFLVGVLIAGGISALVSPSLLESVAGNDVLSLLLMLAIAVPMYVCATASTPIAAALALKGISPGAALVFLLAGPATNAASLAVISRLLGKKSTLVYLVTIVTLSLAAGFLVNYLYGYFGLDITDWVSMSTHDEQSFFSVVSALVLLLLILKAMFAERS